MFKKTSPIELTKEQKAIEKVKKTLDEVNLQIQVVHQIVFVPKQNAVDNKTTN